MAPPTGRNRWKTGWEGQGFYGSAVSELKRSKLWKMVQIYIYNLGEENRGHSLICLGISTSPRVTTRVMRIHDDDDEEKTDTDRTCFLFKKNGAYGFQTAVQILPQRKCSISRTFSGRSLKTHDWLYPLGTVARDKILHEEWQKQTSTSQWQTRHSPPHLRKKTNWSNQKKA